MYCTAPPTHFVILTLSFLFHKKIMCLRLSKTLPIGLSLYGDKNNSDLMCCGMIKVLCFIVLKVCPFYDFFLLINAQGNTL